MLRNPVRRVRVGALLAWLLLGASASVGAQQVTAADSLLPPARRITLPDALGGLEADNLDLRFAREEAAAAQARAVAAGVYPNPGLAAVYEQLSGNGTSYRETTLTLGQTLEIGGQRGLRRDAARLSAEAAEARYDAERLRLTFEARRAYVRAAAAEAELQVLREATEVFRQVEQAGRARFAEGDISDFARQRLQVERARYEHLLANTRLDLTQAGRELALLAAPDSLAGEGFLLLPAEPLDGDAFTPSAVSLDTALLAAARRADVRAASAEVDAAPRRARAAAARAHPRPHPDRRLQAAE